MKLARLVSVVAVSGLAVLALSGCVLVPPVINEVVQNGPVNDREVVDGPVGWTELPSCPAGPRDDYVWVEGFPSDALEEAGIAPVCGDTWSPMAITSST